MVEAKVMSLEREGLRLPDFGLGKSMEDLQGWLKRQLDREPFSEIIKRSLRNIPPELGRILERRKGQTINVDTLATTLEMQGADHEEAKDLAIIYTAATGAETKKPLSIYSIADVLERQLGKIRNTGILPEEVVSGVKKRVVEASDKAASQEVAGQIRDAQGEALGVPGAPAGGPEDLRKKEKRREYGAWMKTGAVFLLLAIAFGVGREYVQRVGWLGIGAQQKASEALAKLVDPDYAEVVKLQEGVSSTKADVLRLIYDRSVEFMTAILEGKEMDVFKGELAYYGMTEEELTDYQIVRARGWTKAIRVKGYIEETGIDGRKLKKDLLRLGYPENLVDKFLAEYEKFAKIKGLGWISKEESLQRQKIQQEIAGARIKARRLTTKPVVTRIRPKGSHGV